ncbi:serine kinase [Mesorhizobium sp. M4A.F.Ca.ET.020.02.1.1]|uniref:phosphotransferase n=1 Tax=unclassified Mesorhizobium TaxID=325217 RepID=UPI000FD2EE24|nr:MULTISPECIES: phosphotransferase [unclassified Mesorhizobium]RVD37473.1 serine kinase [Mesorhizobium sp. M4A.F.Ca.ET.020.02.1.1]RWC15555.1 MAG: serine kinase [Mesorhizobium sp.]
MTEAAASSLDKVLSAPLPDFQAEDLASALHQHFGIQGSLARISGERDLNFRVDASDGRTFVCKISGIADTYDEIAFQNAALIHLASRDPSLPVPRVVPALDGRVIVPLERNGRPYLLRVLSYLAGEPVIGHRATPAQRTKLGELSARLDVALADYAHPAAERSLIWDLVHFSALSGKLGFVENGSQRALAERVFERFSRVVAPRMPALRRQVIHNDLNQNNILIDRDGDVSGLIDFGDMVRTILVAEVAIAAAHQLYREEDVLSVMREIVAGYAKTLPLRDEEIAVLPVLVQSRLATRELIVAWRSKTKPAATTSYRNDISKLGWAALARCDALDERKAQDCLAEAARH